MQMNIQTEVAGYWPEPPRFSTREGAQISQKWSKFFKLLHPDLYCLDWVVLAGHAWSCMVIVDFYLALPGLMPLGVKCGNDLLICSAGEGLPQQGSWFAAWEKTSPTSGVFWGHPSRLTNQQDRSRWQWTSLALSASHVLTVVISPVFQRQRNNNTINSQQVTCTDDTIGKHQLGILR